MRRRLYFKWIVAALLVVLPAVAAHATEGVVVGDAYVNSAHPAVNYGSLSNLYVNSTGTALIQFDLSSLPSGTTSSQISAAYLKIYVNRINTSGLVNIQPVTSSWSESAVTYSSIPTLGTTAASFTPATAQQFVVIDVTSLVQSWVTTPASNYGIALTTTTGDAVFDSKENDETSHAAHLDITVVSQGPAGAAGTAATVTVGTTTTGTSGSNASVSNSGTTSAAVLNFTVPAGATGPTGPTGPTGTVTTSSFTTMTTIQTGFSGEAANTLYYFSPIYSYNNGLAPSAAYSDSSGNYYAANSSLGYPEASSTIAGESNNYIVAASACTMGALNVGAINNNFFENPFPGSDSITISVQRYSFAAGTEGPTGMSCTTAVRFPEASSSTCNDTTHTFAVYAGDLLSIGFQESTISLYGQPTGPNIVTVGLVCQ